jgi:hypothetical protein
MGALALACLGGVLVFLLVGTPAYAEDPADLRLEITSGQIALATGGQPQTVSFVITNDGPGAVSAPVANFDAPLDSRGVTIGGTSVTCQAANGPSVISCPLPALTAGQNVTVTVQLVPPASGGAGPGENVNEDGNAWVTNPGGSDPNSDNDGRSFQAVLTGGGSPVTEVSGTVMDGSSGNGLEGATVEVTDSAGTVGTATTGADGRFSYQPGTPLKAGRIKIKASKDGYEVSQTTVDATNGGTVNDVQLAVSPAQASPTPSATPPPSATPSAAASAAAASTKGDDSGVSLLVVVLVSLLAIAILAGGALWVGLRRNREQEPPPGDESPIRHRPALGDAPTVQLRMDGLGGGPMSPAGTQVMPQFGQPDQAVDATQRIPLPDQTSLIPPPAEYDVTAPFGPATGQLGQPTAMFGAPDPGAGYLSPLPNVTGQQPAYPPAPVPPAYPAPPTEYGPPTEFVPPPAYAPPAQPAGYPPPTDYAPPTEYTSPPTYAPAPTQPAPPPPGPDWSNQPPPPPNDDWFNPPTAVSAPPAHPAPTPPPPSVTVVTPSSAPPPSPLTSQSGAIPPITALVAPAPLPSQPPPPRPGSMPRPSLVLRPDEDLAPMLAPKAAGPPPTAFDPAPVRPNLDDSGRHASAESSTAASDGDQPSHGRHSS